MMILKILIMYWYSFYFLIIMNMFLFIKLYEFIKFIIHFIMFLMPTNLDLIIF